MKAKSVYLICMMLSICFIFSGISNIGISSKNIQSNSNGKELNINADLSLTRCSGKMIIVGRTAELSVGNEISFVVMNALAFYRYQIDEIKYAAFEHYKNIELIFPMKICSFKGILLEKFICGIFEYADVTASPTAITYGQPAEVTITVTINDIGLENTFVSLNVPGLSDELNGKTNTDGQVIFSFTPPTTGEIEVKIENITSLITIQVTSWSI